MKSMSPQLLAGPVHPHCLLKDGSALRTHNKRTRFGSLSCMESGDQAGSRRRGAGIIWGRWAHAAPGGTGWGKGEPHGDFQLWAGENRRGGNAGWAKPCGMTPRTGVNIAGIWRHQRWFSTAGFSSWIYLPCQLHSIRDGSKLSPGSAEATRAGPGVATDRQCCSQQEF